MWMLVHRNAKTRLVAGGRSFLEVCPECGRKARFDEVEITKSYGVFFIDLLDDKERKYRCSACHEVFDLRDGPDSTTSARPEETRQAEREAERAAAADARRAAEADRLRERARAQAVQAKAAQDRAAQDRAAQDRAAQAKAARIEDELAELKKRMGR
jgi:rubredoxin